MIPAILMRGLLQMSLFLSVSAGAWAASPAWPPKVGEPYPEVTGIDAKGHEVSLSAFKGKIIFIEPIGMTHPTCRARAKSLVADFSRATGLKWDDPRVVYIQLLIFNPDMLPTSEDDVVAWEQQFYKGKTPKPIVLAGGPWYLQPERGQASYSMISKVQIIDPDFILRADTAEAPFAQLTPLGLLSGR